MSRKDNPIVCWLKKNVLLFTVIGMVIGGTAYAFVYFASMEDLRHSEVVQKQYVDTKVETVKTSLNTIQTDVREIRTYLMGKKE